MVFFNYSTGQMAAKIVYYGPGLCGKTTNLQYIYSHTSPKSRGEMVSLETETDRTLFFDLLPIEVGTIAGFNTRIQLYTVPGQVFYNQTRKLVLRGVDGIVFVADSQRPMLQANIDSLKNLEDNLNELGLNIDEIPLVLQYNKRDLPNILTVEELNRALNKKNWPYYEASAVQGKGVFETLKGISKLTLMNIKQKLLKGETKKRPKPSIFLRGRQTKVKEESKPREQADAISKTGEQHQKVPKVEVKKTSTTQRATASVSSQAAEPKISPTAVKTGVQEVEVKESGVTTQTKKSEHKVQEPQKTSPAKEEKVSLISDKTTSASATKLTPRKVIKKKKDPFSALEELKKAKTTAVKSAPVKEELIPSKLLKSAGIDKESKITTLQKILKQLPKDNVKKIKNYSVTLTLRDENNNTIKEYKDLEFTITEQKGDASQIIIKLLFKITSQ